MKGQASAIQRGMNAASVSSSSPSTSSSKTTTRCRRPSLASRDVDVDAPHRRGVARVADRVPERDLRDVSRPRVESGHVGRPHVTSSPVASPRPARRSQTDARVNPSPRDHVHVDVSGPYEAHVVAGGAIYALGVCEPTGKPRHAHYSRSPRPGVAKLVDGSPNHNCIPLRSTCAAHHLHHPSACD